MRKERKVTRVMGCALRRQLSVPGAGSSILFGSIDCMLWPRMFVLQNHGIWRIVDVRLLDSLDVEEAEMGLSLERRVSRPNLIPTPARRPEHRHSSNNLFHHANLQSPCENEDGSSTAINNTLTSSEDFQPHDRNVLTSRQNVQILDLRAHCRWCRARTL